MFYLMKCRPDYKYICIFQPHQRFYEKPLLKSNYLVRSATNLFSKKVRK